MLAKAWVGARAALRRYVGAIYISKAAVDRAALDLAATHGNNALARANELDLEACHRMDLAEHHKWHRVAKRLRAKGFGGLSE